MTSHHDRRLVLATVLMLGLSVPSAWTATTPLQAGAMMRALLEQWNALVERTAPTYESARTWIPERGVRGKYTYLHSLLSIAALETAFGQRVFLSGPHTKDMNFVTMTDFGRYNPTFVAAVQQQIVAVAGDDRTKTLAQVVYGARLRSLARTYYLAYRYVQGVPNRDTVRKEYESRVAAGRTCSASPGQRVACSPSWFLHDTFRPFANQQERTGYDLYEASVAPGFWLRRGIDGTDTAFFALLTTVLETFDPGFLERERNK